MTTESLIGGESVTDDRLREQLMIDGLSDSDVQQAFKQAQALTKSVLPNPGFCLKTKTDKEEKVFINVCTAGHLPIPTDITDDELLRLIESEDPSGYRVPLSLGEPHAELDKSGQGCTAYDVIVHDKFLEDVKDRQILMGFFITIVLEGLEQKYDMLLDREWKILKNRKCVGQIQEQHIRTQSKPWIMEVDGSSSQQNEGTNKSLISEVTPQDKQQLPRAPEPPYHIMQEPSEGHPEFLVAEIHLPKVKAINSLTLDIGEDRILLETRSNVYHLDIYLPYNVVQEDCGAQFDRKSKVLTLTLPVQPK